MCIWAFSDCRGKLGPSIPTIQALRLPLTSTHSPLSTPIFSHNLHTHPSSATNPKHHTNLLHPSSYQTSQSLKMPTHTPKNPSTSSKCTTFSDIINALDESYDRISRMSANDLEQERVDSLNSLATQKSKEMPRLTAFDVKKYLPEYKSGNITLLQIQVAANARKLPEDHIADYYRVNGTPNDPWYGTGKCTYPPYAGPQKRKRDVIIDNLDDAVKKVKNVFGK
ncbi:hypothetical protein D6C83_00434 [Aureobasidium pullulans]|uniref:Uncharacterized protein n=1 Tax=Aureobasidium pullulans TaxID=5580 RepID=A0A4T0EJU5_AURPU|nr:hypothetical protein D6C83_00434 [Aureobasidium pullulans]